MYHEAKSMDFANLKCKTSYVNEVSGCLYAFIQVNKWYMTLVVEIFGNIQEVPMFPFNNPILLGCISA